jgi:hypothetical protein
MKKSIFYLIAVLALLLTASCQKDEAPAGEETNVTFTTDLSGKVLSRAIADGLSVNKLAFAVYDESGTEIPALRQYVAVAGKTATVSVRLVSGKKYSFAFFAYKASTGNESAYYNVADLKAIKVSTDYSVNKGNDESRDAFFAYDSETITANLAKTITLRRPFSQLNIVATDVADAEASNVQLPAKADVTVSNVCTTLNALTGEVSDPVTVTIPAGAKITEGITVAGTTYDSKAYVAMNYLLVAKDKGLSDCSIKIADNTDATLTTLSIPNVPVQRNYRTNIIGSLLTNSSKFSIIVDPEFETPDNDVNYVPENSILASNGKYYSSVVEAYNAAVTAGETDIVLTLGKGTYSGDILCVTSKSKVKTVTIQAAKDVKPEEAVFDGQLFPTSGKVIVKNITLTNAHAPGIKTTGMGTSFQWQYPIAMIWSSGNLEFDNVIFNLAIKDQTGIISYWMTDNYSIVVKNCTFNCNYGRAAQLYGTGAGFLGTATFENNTFINPYRYCIKVTSGNNVVNFKNNTVNVDEKYPSGVWNGQGKKATYAIEAGASAYPKPVSENADVFNVEGGTYPTVSDFIPYYKDYDEGQVINGGSWQQ